MFAERAELPEVRKPNLWQASKGSKSAMVTFRTGVDDFAREYVRHGTDGGRHRAG